MTDLKSSLKVKHECPRPCVTFVYPEHLPKGYSLLKMHNYVIISFQVTTYHIHMALQNECHVTVTESRHHQLNPNSASPAQILTLRVNSINPAVRPFDIRCICLCFYKPDNKTGKTLS